MGPRACFHPQSLADVTLAGMSTLRIATLNVWNMSGPWAERRVLIRKELERLDASIVGLQEVLRFAEPNVPVSAARCQATNLAENYGYEVLYGEASEYSHGVKFGNALLSRHKVLERFHYFLPDLGSGESRCLLGALLETEWGALPVFVTHLNWKLHHGAVRLEQAAFIADRIEGIAPLDGPVLPPVLMGDFNADPDSDEIRFLKGLKVHRDRSVFYADAWTFGGDGSLGATWSRTNDYALTSRELSRRIDYVFVRGPDARLRGEPLHTTIAFGTPEERGGARVWPSDHFGLVTDVHFAPRA